MVFYSTQGFVTTVAAEPDSGIKKKRSRHDHSQAASVMLKRFIMIKQLHSYLIGS